MIICSRRDDIRVGPHNSYSGEAIADGESARPVLNVSGVARRLSEIFDSEHVNSGHPLRMIHSRRLLVSPESMDADIETGFPLKFALAGQAQLGLG
jgi:hypothetical protein